MGVAVSETSFSIHRLKSTLPRSNDLEIILRISIYFSRYKGAIRVDKSIALLFKDLISTLIFFSPNIAVALPYPVIDCIITNMFFCKSNLFMEMKYK